MALSSGVLVKAGVANTHYTLLYFLYYITNVFTTKYSTHIHCPTVLRIKSNLFFTSIYSIEILYLKIGCFE